MISITSIPYRLSAETIFLSAIFKDKQEEKVKVGLAESVVDPGEVRLVYIYPLDKEENSFIYMELDTKLFGELLSPYEGSANILIKDKDRSEWGWYSSEACRSIYPVSYTHLN